MLYPQQLQHYRSIFLSDILHFSITHSMFDLWICSLIRLGIILGALCGFLRNTTDGVQRTRKARTIILIICVIMWDYPIVKLLIYTEQVTDYNLPFFWALFAWSLFATCIFCINWTLLGTFKSLRTRSLHINGTPPESESLLGSTPPGTNTNTQTDTEEEKPFQISIVCRLLAYSKPDWPILLLAFIFLGLSSLGEIQT